MSKRFNNFVPVFVATYLLIGLSLFLLLQRNLNDWVDFMQNDAAVASFGVFAVVGIVGFGLVFLLKKKPDILSASPKILKATFLLVLMVAAGTFTYLNFTSTQDNYAWLSDGLLYQKMGLSLLSDHEFMFMGNFTHNAGPIYPMYLAVFYLFLPAHLGSQIAVEIAFVAAALTVFFITKRMYGQTPALITTALATAVPIYIFSTSRGYSEPLMAILYTVTLFFILESLKPGKENRIILAGFFAALGILTKSSFGYFFIVTGVIGFLWRFYYVQRGVFKNRNYVAATGVFFSLVLAWTGRNLYHFFDGTLASFLAAIQPSDYMNAAMIYTFSNEVGSYLVQCLIFLAMSLVFASAYVWVFGDYLKASLKRFREERISLLVVSAVLPMLIGVLVSAVFFVYENHWMADYLISYAPVTQVRYFMYNLVRYFFIALVPMTWAAYEVARKLKPEASPLQ
jgi:4-amino-4-deoxy-L-arabinose transferase-like glycosyltransferase